MQTMIRELFETRAIEHKELKLIQTHTHHKDGRTLVLESSAIPYFSKRGTLLGYRGVSRDITELKKGEEIQALLAAIVTSSDDAIIRRRPEPAYHCMEPRCGAYFWLYRGGDHRG